jgi:hypothetical protein
MAILAPAKSCCDINEEETSQIQDRCPGCKDESIVVEPGDDYEVPSITFNFENTHNTTPFLTSVILNYFKSIDEPTNNEVPWYKEPPPYKEVILSQIQSYLI